MLLSDEGLLSGILLVMLVFFVQGRYRYDLVAVVTLLICLFLDLVPIDRAFTGFSNSAVITVAAVFVVSRGIENTGVLGELAYRIKLRKKVIWKQVGLLCLLVATLSSFMNNVGALALLMPVAMSIARTRNIPRYLLLMPMAFSSLLGGLVTLVGTPPNLIVSDFRRYNLEGPFTFFDYTPVGLGVALVGVLFVALVGWRLLYFSRKMEGEEEDKHEHFIAELILTSRSRLVDKKVAQFIHSQEEGGCSLLAIVRDGELIQENLEYHTAKAGDGLIVETDKWRLQDLISDFKLTLSPRDVKTSKEDHYLVEIAVLPNSVFCRDKISHLNLEEHYGISVVAISHKRELLTERLPEIAVEPGDSLMIKSEAKISPELLETLGCISLEETHVRPYDRRGAIKVFTVLGIALLSIIFGVLPTDVAFVTVAATFLSLNILSIENAYNQINWPVVVLVGALIPVGEAMVATGATKTIAQNFHALSFFFPASVILYLLILACMLLSNVMNNAAVALIFSPLAFQLASELGLSPDPFLMAVAVGASCTFLTPIGHQSNTMIMGPGNYRFQDYWRMGLPLSLIVSVFATGLILLVWPF